MKKRLLSCILAIIILISFSISSVAADLYESIQVIRNKVKIEVNGKPVSSDTFSYNGTTYVPLRTVSESFGAKVGWDGNRNVATLTTANSAEIMKVSYNLPVTVANSKIDLDVIQTTSDQIDTYKLDYNGEKLEAKILYDGHSMLINPTRRFSYSTTYNMTLYLSNGLTTSFSFTTEGVPNSVPSLTKKTILMPANPSEGFNYPYYLIIPSKASVLRNAGKKNFLMVETHNTGKVGDSLDFHIEEALTIAERNSASIAEQMGLPRIVPVLIRPESTINGEFIYTHLLTRNTIYLQDIKKKAGTYPEVFNDMDRVDIQVANMIKHAYSVLRRDGWKMEDKVFLWGFSASGSFANQFSFLHPELVKATCHGSFPHISMSSTQGIDLVYPFGTADYKEITGKDFNLQEYNSVARFGYIGSVDNNNPTLPDDIYTQLEKDIINKVLAVKEYPDQWEKRHALYKTTGGEAQMNVYIGSGHEIFYKGMTQDYLNFFEANRLSDTPVYVLPSDPATTETVMYSKNIVSAPAPINMSQTTVLEAFWSGVTPKYLPDHFVKTLEDNVKYNAQTFLISIEEWEITKDHEQMESRLDKTRNSLILRAVGKLDVHISIAGTATSGTGDAQVFFAHTDGNVQSGVEYSLIDISGTWMIQGITLVRP